MSKRLIERFKNYTCQMNRGFKIAFDNSLVVSVVFTDHNGTEFCDENHNIIKPEEIPFFTFKQADLCVFNQDTDKNMTEIFCKDIEGYSDYEEIVYSIEPIELAKVMYNVSKWENK